MIDWSRVLPEHARWLRVVVYSRVGDAEGVDEVMQEIALAAVRQASPLLDPAYVRPWLYRLAVYQSLLYRRKRGRLRKLNHRVREVAPTLEVADDPLRWLLADERRQLVRRALSRLRRRDMEILLLKYSENWTYEQISSHLGISTSAVEARLHRARQRMREQLARLNVVEARP